MGAENVFILNPFIVAEISKTWINGEAFTEGLLCQRFEEVINTNLGRGYRLQSFQLHQLMVSRADDEGRDNHMIETIIAVFARIDV